MKAKCLLLVFCLITLGNTPASAAPTIVFTRDGPTSLSGCANVVIKMNFQAVFSCSITRLPPYQGNASCSVDPATMNPPSGTVTSCARMTSFAIDNYANTGQHQIASVTLKVRPGAPLPGGQTYQVQADGLGSLSFTDWPTITRDGQTQYIAQTIGALPAIYTFGPAETLPDWRNKLIRLWPAPGSPSVLSGCIDLPVGGHTGTLSGSVIYKLGHLGSMGSFSATLTPSMVAEPSGTFQACITLSDFQNILPGLRSVMVADLNVSVLEGGSWSALGVCPVAMDFPPYSTFTRVGSQVVIVPRESSTAVTPVTLVFSSVTQPGETSLTISESPAGTPAGFRLGQPPLRFDISTTATYVPPIHIQIDYSGISFAGPPEELRLFHYDGSAGHWVDCTEYVDTVGHVIHGNVDSLSPFVVCEPAAPSVDIDIQPNRTPNEVYLSKNYTIYVAVLGNKTFDVTTLDSTTVRFGRTGTEASPLRAPTIRDLNGDGFADALYGFLTSGCGFKLGDVTGSLTGQTTTGTPIAESDSVLVRP